MEKERIEELMQAGTLTREERAEIREAAEKAGLPVNVKQGCRRCYEKLLTALYETNNPIAAVSADGWMLRNVNDAFKIFGSEIVYSNATLPSLEVGDLHPSVISTRFIKANTGEDTAEPETSAEEGKGTDDVL